MGTTSNFSWTYPTVGGSTDTWGTTLNNAIIAVDASLFAIAPASAGTIDNMVIGGSTPRNGTFGNLTAGNASVTTLATIGNATVTTALAFGASGTVTVPNAGFFIKDTDASNTLGIVPGSNLTANRILTLTTGDAARTVTINGDVTLPAGTTLIAGNNLSDLSNASTARTNLGVPLGTSGAVVPLLSTQNTWSAKQLMDSSFAVTTGFFEVQPTILPTQIAANTNDWAPTGWQTTVQIHMSSDAARNLTGISNTSINSGRILIITNIGSFTITMKNQDANSSAANRFGFGADYALLADGTATIMYDGNSNRWRLIGHS